MSEAAFYQLLICGVPASATATRCLTHQHFFESTGLNQIISKQRILTMKTQLTLKRRLVWLALLGGIVAALMTPAVAHHMTASVNEPVQVAVNWNSKPAPTPTPKP